MSRIPSSFDQERPDFREMSFGERVIFHCKQQPLVPVGCLLTSGAVVLAALSVKSGNRMRAQYYFRWRVGLQAATLIALVAGSYVYGTTKEQRKKEEDLLREKARRREQLWIQELELRDAAALERKRRAALAREKFEATEK